MKRSVLSLAIGIVALATALAVKHIPRSEPPGDQAELDALRRNGAI